jgi:hypothetical protein
MPAVARLLVAFSHVVGMPGGGPPADLPAAEPAAAPHIAWVENYAEATRQAREQRRMLFVYFYAGPEDKARQKFEQEALLDEVLEPHRDRYVWLRLPLDGTITVGGQAIRVAQHAAFANLRGRQGIAMIDFEHVDQPYYGYVVSEFPFTSPRYYSRRSLEAILALPSGTLTQRTMIYAVRTHPDAPQSALGNFNPVLAGEAESHSRHQADIHVQGHHAWESRYHRITARLPGNLDAQEVVAESWPNEELVDAAVDCVDCWRQSDGHWDAVRRRHPLFGFDMKLGRNGIWYATGIFGRRR